MASDEEEQVEGEGAEEPSAPRSVEKIVLRDYDRIQEREPFQPKPVHIRSAIAGGVLVVALAAIGGWLIGRSDRDEPKETKTETVAVTGSEASTKGPLSQARDVSGKAPGGRNVSGSIMPLPSPEPRGPVSATLDRRAAVVIAEEVRPPEPEFVDWTFWPGLLATTCDYSCVSPDGDCRPEDRPVPEPPAPDPEPSAPIPEMMEPSPDVTEPELDTRETADAKTVSAPLPDVNAPEPAPVQAAVVKAAEPAMTVTSAANAEVTPEPAVAKPKATTEAIKKVVVKPPEAPARKFAVQIRSFKEEPMAKEFADQIRAKGYNPFVVSYTDAAGATWFRVRIGSFDTATDAATFASELNARESEQSIPVEVK